MSNLPGVMCVFLFRLMFQTKWVYYCNRYWTPLLSFMLFILFIMMK